MKKLYISLIFSNLVVQNLLGYKIIVMHNFIAKFRKMLEICKQHAGNQVNEKGNVPRRGVIPTFSDLEAVALSITAEAFSIDSGNYLFVCLNSECPNAIPNLIARRQYNQRRKLARLLGDKGYLSAPIQQDLFSSANIILEVPYRLNQKNWRPPTWAYKKFRKRIETVFSQLDDHLMMIRNYAKQPQGFFTRMAAKVAAFTVLQYFNFLNHKPIGQVKYALI